MYNNIIESIIKYIEYGDSYLEKHIIREGERHIYLKLIGRIYGRTLEETIKLRLQLASQVLNEREAYIYVLNTVGLGEISHILLQKHVEDILLIPGRYIYITINGMKYKTKKLCTIYTIKNLLKIARSKYIELTTAMPSFRFGIKLGKLRLRISVDLPPVVELPQAFIRIHRKKYNIYDLIYLQFISKNHYKIIKEIINNSYSLVISGPPGSGKTTLLVAIDDLLDPGLQRVYIDEADEFEDDINKNQIKVRNVNKIKEIYASLNRNIDIVVIGELQYPEHFEAFRTALEMGFQTFATMHARTTEQTIRRLKQYGIPLESLGIVQLERRDVRRVKEIHVGGVPQ